MKSVWNFFFDILIFLVNYRVMINNVCDWLGIREVNIKIKVVEVIVC